MRSQFACLGALLFVVTVDSYYIPNAREWSIHVSNIPGLSGEGCKAQCVGWKCTLACSSGGQTCQAFQSPTSSCCKTCKTFNLAPWAYWSEERRHVVYPVNQHWDGGWQLIPIGECVDSGACGRGARCTEQKHASPILVADRPLYSRRDMNAANIWYEFLYFDSHCDCQKSSRWTFETASFMEAESIVLNKPQN